MKGKKKEPEGLTWKVLGLKERPLKIQQLMAGTFVRMDERC